MTRSVPSEGESVGTNAEEGTAKVEEKLPHANPLEFYISELLHLRNLPGYSVSTVDLTSHPLPEERPRVWILGSPAQGVQC